MEKNITRKFYEGNKLYFEIIDKNLETSDLYEKLYSYDDKTLWLDSSKVEEGLSRFSIFGLQSEKRGHILKYNVDDKIVKKIYFGAILWYLKNWDF